MDDQTIDHIEASKARLSRGERRLLLLRYASLLFQIPKVKDSSAMEIQRVIVHYNVIKRKFEELDVSREELTDLIFEQFVRDRMDEETNRVWDRHVYHGSDPTWEELCSFMHQRSESLYRIQNFGGE